MCYPETNYFEKAIYEILQDDSGKEVIRGKFTASNDFTEQEKRENKKCLHHVMKDYLSKSDSITLRKTEWYRLKIGIFIRKKQTGWKYKISHTLKL